VGTDAAGNPVYNRMQKQVMTAIVHPAHAQAGIIDVRGDVFKGSGRITSPGDASITIVNNTPAFLEVQGAVIPEKNGGLRFNGEELTDNQAITEANADSVTASFSSVPNVELTTPSITISSTFDPRDVPAASIPAPAITIRGEVTNRSGDINITNASGDIRIIDDPTDGIDPPVVSGANVAISAGGSVFVDGVMKWHAGADPYTTFRSAIFDGNEPKDPGTVSDAEITSAASQLNGTVNGKSVYIDSEYINVNGLIKSGRSSYDLTIGDSAISEINRIRRSGRQGVVRITSVSDQDLYVVFDPSTNQIRVRDLRVEGGHISLTGKIMSTSQGKVEVLGGYSDINITNHSSYDLVLEQIDGASRGAGTVVIIDTAKPSGGREHTTTLYQRNDQVSTKTLNDIPTAFSGTDTYQPASGWRYGWAVGFEEFTRSYNRSCTSAWIGIDAFAADPDDVNWSGTERVDDPILMDDSEYFFTSSSNNVIDHGVNTFATQAPRVYELDRSSTSTWYGKTTHCLTMALEEREQNIHKYSVDADRAFDINFIGNEENTVRVISTQPGTNVILEGRIASKGLTHIDANGKILQSNNSSVVTGDRVTLEAASGIGNATLLGSSVDEIGDQRILLSNDGSGTRSGALFQTNIGDSPTSRLNATTNSGSVHIEEQSGSLRLGGVSSQSGGDVYLVAPSDVLAVSQEPTHHIKGGVVVVDSASGTIGLTSAPLKLDSGSDAGNSIARDFVSLDAGSGIFIEEISGDLHLKQALTESGDVHLEVAGNVYDVNNSAIRDERTYNELKAGVWSDLQLTDSTGANDKVNETLTAYSSTKLSEYDAYWNYRRRQADPTVYDADFIVPLNPQESDYYLSNGYDEQTIVNKLTAEYHDLHQRHGSVEYDAYWDVKETMPEATVSVDPAGVTHSEYLNTYEVDLSNLVIDTLYQFEILDSEGTAIDALEIEFRGDHAFFVGEVQRFLENAKSGTPIYGPSVTHNASFIASELEHGSKLVLDDQSNWLDILPSLAVSDKLQLEGAITNNGLASVMVYAIDGSELYVRDLPDQADIAEEYSVSLTLAGQIKPSLVNVSDNILSVLELDGSTSQLQVSSSDIQDLETSITTNVVALSFDTLDDSTYQLTLIYNSLVDGVDTAFAETFSLEKTSSLSTEAYGQLLRDSINAESASNMLTAETQGNHLLVQHVDGTALDATFIKSPAGDTLDLTDQLVQANTTRFHLATTSEGEIRLSIDGMTTAIATTAQATSVRETIHSAINNHEFYRDYYTALSTEIETSGEYPEGWTDATSWITDKLNELNYYQATVTGESILVSRTTTGASPALEANVYTPNQSAVGISNNNPATNSRLISVQRASIDASQVWNLRLTPADAANPHEILFATATDAPTWGQAGRTLATTIDLSTDGFEAQYVNGLLLVTQQSDAGFTSEFEVTSQQGQAQFGEDEASYFHEYYTSRGTALGKEGSELTTWVQQQKDTTLDQRTALYNNIHARYINAAQEDVPSFLERTTRSSEYVDKSQAGVYEYLVDAGTHQELTAGIKIWTEDELLNLIGGGLLSPITDTQVSIEDPNISGNNITINSTSGSIGKTSGQRFIDRTDLTIDLTNDERVALSAAERTDVAYLAGAITVNVTISGTTIVSNNFNWEENGFEAGDRVWIGTGSLNSSGAYSLPLISGVSGNTLTLVTDTPLIPEQGVNVSFQREIRNAAEPAFSESIGVVISLFASNDYNGSYLQLDNGQTWSSVLPSLDNGDRIQLSGTGTNDPIVNELNVHSIDGAKLYFRGITGIVDQTSANADIASQIQVIQAIAVNQLDDLDLGITGSGTLTVDVSENAFIGSEQELRLNTIVAGGAVRIKTAAGIVNST
ncbi:MAG: hypothetical protein HOB20_17940, partial [Planctomycetaceae bacterium]|nr:hypothetical protein [Planctomycetaceae bacterium]